MPHKKNPDVFEIIRARCNQLVALPNSIAMGTSNLPSGYHRDLQLLKEMLFPAIQQLKQCLQMAHLMISNISVKNNILDDEKYKFLFSVEEVNKLVLSGVPFRDAYKQVGMDIEQSKYDPSPKVAHTHIGSIGNLSNNAIAEMMTRVLKTFPFEKIAEKEKALIG